MAKHFFPPSLILLLFFSFLLGGCWIPSASQKDLDIPQPSSYLEAIGEGHTPLEAQENALRSLSLQISAKIESVDFKETIRKNGKVYRYFQSVLKVSSFQDIPGVKVRFYQKYGKSYAKVFLQKKNFLNWLYMRFRKLEREAMGRPSFSQKISNPETSFCVSRGDLRCLSQNQVGLAFVSIFYRVRG